MGVVARDTFTGPDWKPLVDHTAEQGGKWKNHPAYGSSDPDVIRIWRYQGRALFRNYGAMFLDAASASADYYVEADYHIKTDIAHTAIAFRMSKTANTYYFVYYSGGEWVLAKSVAGSVTSFGWYIATFSPGTHTVRIGGTGTTIYVDINGVNRISETDSSISAAGVGGLRSYDISNYNTGKHIDNFLVADATVAAQPRSRVIGLIGL
jgi:hypothetical protein